MLNTIWTYICASATLCVILFAIYLTLSLFFY